MKKISDGSTQYMSYVGQTFICPKTGSEFKVEAQDIQSLGNDRSRIKGLTCPDCNKLVTFESDQRDGQYLSHK